MLFWPQGKHLWNTLVPPNTDHETEDLDLIQNSLLYVPFEACARLF